MVNNVRKDFGFKICCLPLLCRFVFICLRRESEINVTVGHMRLCWHLHNIKLLCVSVTRMMSLGQSPDLVPVLVPAPVAAVPVAASQGAATQEVAQTQAASLILTLKSLRGRMVRITLPRLIQQK